MTNKSKINLWVIIVVIGIVIGILSLFRCDKKINRAITDEAIWIDTTMEVTY